MQFRAKSFKTSLYLIFIAVLLLTAAAQGRVIEDFQTIGSWKFASHGFVDHDKSSLKIVEIDGRRALKVSYVLKPIEEDKPRYVALEASLGNKAIAAPASVWVYGDGSNKSFRLRVRDEDGEIYQITYGAINWENEWRQLVFPDFTPGANGVSNWGGKEDDGYKNVINGRPTFNGFILDYGKASLDQEISGTFYIADFEAAPDFEEGVSITLADTVLNSNGTGGIYWRNQGEGQLTYGGTIDGKHIWQTNPEDGKHYMFLDVDDAYIYGHPQDCAVEVAVEYFDDTPSGNGPYLHYRNPSGAYVSSPINGSMGKGWRTARFLLTDVNFANNLDGYDFRIIGDKLPTGDPPVVYGKPVKIHKVTVRKLPVGTVTGTVAGIADAVVTAVHPDYLETPVRTTTGPDGNFTLERLPEGIYTIYIAAKGHSREKIENVVVTAGSNTELGSIQLQAGFPEGLWVDLGRFNDENGLTQSYGNERRPITMVDPDGTEYKQTDRSRREFFLTFDVDKIYFPANQMEAVEFQVTYLDKGTGNWRIDYRGGESGSWIQGDKIRVKKENTGEWKTAVIRVVDARLDVGADQNFRLNCYWDGGEDDDYFSRVVVKKLETHTVQGSIVSGAFQQPFPLPGVTVTLTGVPFSNVVFETVTDSSGNFTISGVPAGQYLLKATSLDAGNGEMLITVSENQTHFPNIPVTIGWWGFDESLWPSASAGNNFTLVEDEKYSGRTSLHAVADAGVMHWTSTARFAVDKSLSYLLSARIKTENMTNSVRISIQQVTADDKDNGWFHKNGNVALITAKDTNEWTYYSHIIEPDQFKESTDTIKIYIYVHEGQGKVWIDDLTLVPVLKITDLEQDVEIFSPEQGGKVKVNVATNIISSITAEVLDEEGQLVTVLGQDVPLYKSVVEVVWDGKAAGESVADGTYTIKITATSGLQVLEELLSVTVKSQGPAQPVITSPVIESGTVPVHNVDRLHVSGKVELEPGTEVTVKAVRTVDGEEFLTEGVLCDENGNFTITVTLFPNADNTIYVLAYDELGNPSIASGSFTVHYDPEAAMGLVHRANTDLLSPQNQDGVRDQMEISFFVNVAAEVKLTVYSGDEVAYRRAHEADAGEEVSFIWDGTDENGEYLADGLYLYEITIDGLGVIESGELVIDNTPPQQVSLVHPKAGMKLSLPPLLSWEAAAGADRYELWYSQDSSWEDAVTVTLAETKYQLPQLDDGTWHWQVVAVDEAGNRSVASEGFFQLKALDTSSFKLINFAFGPNPYVVGRDVFAVSFTLQQPAQVELKLFNLAGIQVYSLKGSYDAGDHHIKWDGCDQNGRQLAKGAYILRLEAANPSEEGTVVRQNPVLILR